MTKAKLYYWTDVGIGIAFLASAVSGLVFLLPGSSGADPSAGVLGISYPLWDQLHIWASLGMIAGVLAHVVLHRNWVAAMTRKILSRQTVRKEAAVSVAGSGLTRRQVLSLGCAAAFIGVVTASAALVVRAEALSTDLAGSSGSALADTVQEPQPSGRGVACRWGLVNDPYPGRCRRYADRNGDGICDYSVLGSGNN